MNHNEEVPDFLGGLGDMLPADVLKVLNELLEQLHRKDKDHQGSTVFIYAPGSQYVDKQFILGKTQPEQKSELKIRDSQPPNYKFAGTEAQSQEDRIRRCIALLMTERYGDEPLFNLQGHWQAVYRILVDKGYCRDSDFDGFDAFIRTVMPEKVNKPYKKDSVKNINKTDYNKPFDRWQYDPSTSGTRKPFERMQVIAQRFKEILEENAG